MSIDKFKKALKHGGARSNLFRVSWELSKVGGNLEAPSGTVAPGETGAKLLNFMCRATTLPTSSLTAIDVNYQGRVVKLAGVRPAFEDWTVTVINDEDMKIRRDLENWMELINGTESNRRNGGVNNDMATYKCDNVRVESLSKTGEETVIGGYELIGAFPTNLGEVTLDWSNDTIQEYTVTFSFDYFKGLNKYDPKGNG